VVSFGRVLVAGLFLTVAASGWAVPLSWEALSGLVWQGTSDEQILALVRREGVSFELTFDYVAALRAAGRSHAFLHALVHAVNKKTGEEESAPAAQDTGEGPPRVLAVPRGGPEVKLSSCLPLDFRMPKGGEPDRVLSLAASEMDAALATEAAGMREVATTHWIAAWQVLRKGGFENAACMVAREAMGRWYGPADYACALLAFEASQGAVECPLKDPTIPARVNLAQLPANVIAAHLYLVGRDLVRSGEGETMGRQMLMAVPEASPYRADALRRVALLLLEARQFRSATRLLIEALGAAKASGASADLALVDLGRIAFENDLYDTAMYYYGQVDFRSRVWPRAVYERAWAALLAGNLSRSLGAVVALKHLGLATMDAFPDLGLIKASAYASACMYPEARAAAEEALLVLKGLEAALGLFGPAMDAPESLDIKAAVEAFPAIERSKARLLATFRTAKVELALLRGVMGPGTERFIQALAEHVASIEAGTAKAVAAELRQLREALFWTRARLLELQVDLGSEERERLARQVLELEDTKRSSARDTLLAQLKDLARKGASTMEVIGFAEVRGPDAVLLPSDIEELRFSGLSSDAIEELKARFMIRAGPGPVTVDPAGIDTRVMWDFDGEVWADEVNGLRVELPDRCEREQASIP